MKKSILSLDEKLAFLENQDNSVEYAWCIPIDVWYEAFGFEVRNNTCGNCGKKQNPDIPFTFVTEDGERIVGMINDHFECSDIDGVCYNQSVYKYVNQNSEMNKSLKRLFEEILKDN